MIMGAVVGLVCLFVGMGAMFVYMKRSRHDGSRGYRRLRDMKDDIEDEIDNES